MQKTSIEYLTHTWNPVKMKCSKVSPGCDNCWHLAQCEMRKNNPKLPEKLRQVYTAGTAYLDYNELHCSMPQKPAVIGVQFMGDLFHEQISFEWIRAINKKIENNPQHTFVILTKRPERLHEYWKWQHGNSPLGAWNFRVNTFIGVTCENQEQADKRIPALLKTPAFTNFVSIEPMLGEVSLGNSFYSHLMLLDLVICGGESGTGSRPLNPENVISLRDECKDYGVPFYFKQWGDYAYSKMEFKVTGFYYQSHKTGKSEPITKDNFIVRGKLANYVAEKVGKKKAGNLLHGVKYEEFPKARR